MKYFFKTYLNLLLILGVCICSQKVYAIFNKDVRTRNIKYHYNINKDNLQYERDKEILDLRPSGYMTTEEYEAQSSYKNPQMQEVGKPKVQLPSDFKYVPTPLYKIVKYNDPPGGQELVLGKKLYTQKMVNTQGITSPDFTQMAYSAIYYYADSNTVAADVFTIPLDTTKDNLNRILTANIMKRNPKPILSTQKEIVNYAAFRTLTPVDFSTDGSKLLVKGKVGSSEDGIWYTTLVVYDVKTKTGYDLSEIRDVITYYWTEKKKLRLEEKLWDIYPLGFDANNPERVDVQAFAYTGSTPVFLGTWSIDSKGQQTRLLSLDINKEPVVSANGYKIIADGVESYVTTTQEQKAELAVSKQIKKDYKKQQRDETNKIKTDYKYDLKALKDEVRKELRDTNKLQTLKGSTEDIDIQEAYEQYLKTRWRKDIRTTKVKIKETEKQIENLDKKIEPLEKELDVSPDSSQELENTEK